MFDYFFYLHFEKYRIVSPIFTDKILKAIEIEYFTHMLSLCYVELKTNPEGSLSLCVY